MIKSTIFSFVVAAVASISTYQFTHNTWEVIVECSDTHTYINNDGFKSHQNNLYTLQSRRENSEFNRVRILCNGPQTQIGMQGYDDGEIMPPSAFPVPFNEWFIASSE